MNSIECRGVTCRPAELVVLEGVSFALGAGEWAVMMGPSASGKTTLLRAIAGLQPLAAGEILINGKPASGRRIVMPPHERGLGLLFQDASLWPHLSVRANVELGLGRIRPGAARRAEAVQWLERLGAAHLADKFPANISGGERRLAELARTLAARPSILLLDEPTTHLDVHLRDGLMRRLRELHAELGLTTLCVTHEVERWLNPADRALILEAGRLIHDGSLNALPQESDYTETLNREIKDL
ncbi:ATP-binding cassette domain-containing protein [bacterium]|nr:ATP-binding cassette domain-containing protein [bacterium]